MSFLCLGLSLADLASCAGPVASGESRGPLDLVPWPAACLCAQGGKEVFRPPADRLSYQTTAALNSLSCIAGGTASAGNVIHIEVVIPQSTAESDATRLDTTMLVVTGIRERTEGE